jgi:hypothetical protein
MLAASETCRPDAVWLRTVIEVAVALPFGSGAVAMSNKENSFLMEGMCVLAFCEVPFCSAPDLFLAEFRRNALRIGKKASPLATHLRLGYQL